MTPNEKAIELIDEYRNTIMSFLNDNMKHQNAKKCALIAVDEILSVINRDTNYQNVYAYFLEVKQEIEKL